MSLHSIIAWSLWVLTLGFAGLTVVLVALGWDADIPDAWGFQGQGALFGAISATVGLVVALNRPSNPIGWVFSGVGMMGSISDSSGAYFTYILSNRDRASFFAEFSGWIGDWLWIPMFGTVAIGLFMLFPDGHFLSARWRAAGVVSGLVIVFVTLTSSLFPGPLVNTPYLTNPFGLTAVDTLLPFPVDSLLMFMTVPLGAAAASLAVRFKRARGQERQQVKWLLVAAMAFVIAVPFNVLPYKLVQYASVAVLSTIPIASGIAILKYRLYDIDLIINRALVYGALTVSLGATYFVAVVLFQAVFRGVTGQDSTLALVASTLAIAALFQPMRRRTQTLIDRRFYRRQYDAAKTLTAFAITARDEVDLERLAGAVVVAAADTVQPAHVSLWLREPARQQD